MGQQLFAHPIKTILQNGINSGDTSITVKTGYGIRFPNPSSGNYFLLTLEFGGNIEIVKCTARNVDTLTVIRAQEGTMAQSWSSGTTIEMRLTANTLSNYTLPSVGNPILIDTQISTGGPYLTFTGLGYYNTYEFRLHNVRGDFLNSTELPKLRLRISTDNGSTWKSGSIDYSLAGDLGASTRDCIRLAESMFYNDVGGASGVVKAFNLGASSIYKVFTFNICHSWFQGGGFDVLSNIGSGAYVTDTSAINGVQFSMRANNAGIDYDPLNIVSGSSISLWGY